MGMVRRFVGGWIAVAALAATLGSGGCGRSPSVAVDGSSTVYRISAAVAEEFRQERSADPEKSTIRATVGKSGTGGGMEKFLSGEIDVCDASRPITVAERKRAEKRGVGFIELPVALDGIAVVVHPDNKAVDHLTTEELGRIWQADSDVAKWSDVRSAWPDKPIELFGPGRDSGTFDYFREVICGEAGVRSDFQASEDDNVLVQGVAGEPHALGYFGYAYYEANKEKLKLVPIDSGDGPVSPTKETIRTGAYKPLSRPLFIYVREAAAKKKAVQAFVEFYLRRASELVGDVGYVPLPEEAYQLALKRFRNRRTGSMFEGGPEADVAITELLRRASKNAKGTEASASDGSDDGQ